MEDKVELYCTFDEEENIWHVWFPHPLGGMNVLESFESEIEAKEFWAKEISEAKF